MIKAALYLTIPALLTLGAAAQTAPPANMQKDDLFAGTEKFAKNASDVTEVNMDPQMLQMVQGKSANRAHGMLLNVVRTYEFDKPGMYNIADVEAIRNRLSSGEWHCSVHTRDLKHGESTDVCNRARNDGYVETAIITVEPKELTFVHTIKQADGSGGGGVSLGSSFTSGLPVDLQLGLMRAQIAGELAGIQPRIGAEMKGVQPVLQAEIAAMQKRLEKGSATPQVPGEPAQIAPGDPAPVVPQTTRVPAPGQP